jgi:hypothetical protein
MAARRIPKVCQALCFLRASYLPLRHNPLEIAPLFRRFSDRNATLPRDVDILTHTGDTPFTSTEPSAFTREGAIDNFVHHAVDYRENGPTPAHGPTTSPSSPTSCSPTSWPGGCGPTSITANALHPGVVSTAFGAEDPGAVQRLFVPFMRPFMKAPAQGAATSIHLASAPDLERVTGRYFANSRPKRSSKRSYDEAAAARLWQVSADLVGLTAAG